MHLRSIFKRNWGFTTTVFFLVFINILVVLIADLQISRFARLVTVAGLVIFYIFNRQLKNIWVGIALSCFLLQELFFQFYEQSWGYKGYMLMGGLAYSIIILECLPKFTLKVLNSGLIAVAVLLIIANTYTLYVIIDMLSLDFKDNLDVFLFYLYGALMMILGLIAIAYNNKYNSTRSLRYTLLVFCFIFSDIAALFAYYFGFEFFYIFSRLFFITAIGLFISYGLNYEIAREEIYQYEMIDKKL
ncbi:MAG TPA: hypothetical protein ENH91_12245 [Leeuwenhoekiella sp.]|nr:hypothetical protein [Leeuwenhoekiella sp.]